MRIIAGEYRRRRFDIPKSFSARPTTDFAKENLFNVLVNNYIDFEGIQALDLFSGTGSITFELLSRGAAHVCAVESRREHASFIRRTAEQLGCLDKLDLRCTDVFKYLGKPTVQAFDFVFADPPYALEDLEDLPRIIRTAEVLNSDGLLVLEHPRLYSFSTVSGFVDHRKYGSVNFSFFRFD